MQPVQSWKCSQITEGRFALPIASAICKTLAFLGKSHSYGRGHHQRGAELQKTAAGNAAGFQVLFDGGLWSTSLVGHAAFLSLETEFLLAAA